jgi:hypothetical protein
MKRKSIIRMLIVCLSLVMVFSVSSTALAAHYYNQDVTAYVAPSGSLTASGKTPEALDVAVHTSGGSPIFPFGTIIFTDTALVVDRYGYTARTFNVQDTGTGPGLSTYWFDIYYGVNTTANTQAATNFGIQQVSYQTFN